MLAQAVQAILPVAVGLALLLCPARIRRKWEDQDAARLAELDAGAEESFFEEKRSLHAWPTPSASVLRLWGAILLLLTLGWIWLKSQQ